MSSVCLGVTLSPGDRALGPPPGKAEKAPAKGRLLSGLGRAADMLAASSGDMASLAIIAAAQWGIMVGLGAQWSGCP